MLAYESMAESFPYGLDPGRMPPPTGGFPGNGSYDMAGWWWFNYIDVYKGGSPRKPSILKCPAKYLTVRWMQIDILCGNYGANLSLCKYGDTRLEMEFKGKPLSRNDVRFPSETILLADSGYALITYLHTTINPPPLYKNQKWINDTAYIPGLSTNSQRKFWPGQEKDAIDGRHPGKTVNVGFVDGHVERADAGKLLSDSKGNSIGEGTIRWKAK